MDWFHDETTLLEEVKRTRRVTTRPLSIDGFEDLQLFRRGGQGAVYTAIQKSTRRRVAIKVLHDDGLGRASPGGGSESRRRRFELEIDLIAKLQHPNIVQIYDSGVTDDDRLYFVMEYIEGLPLGEYVGTTDAPGGGLTVERRMRLFAEICEGVAFAHRHGVIHRDLKPSNIRIDPEGRPHVLDFGIAKVTTADAAAAITTGMTLTGQFLGTLAYASPEQLQSDPALVDIRTDVYALGVMLYEMLTGRHPYPAAGPVAEIISAVTLHDPVAPSRAERAPGGPAAAQRINDEVDTITLKALAKEPARRYQSAEALKQDVVRYLAGEPIDAKRDSTFYVLRKTVARHRLPAALGAAFLISLIGFTIALYISNERSRLEAAKATQIKVFLEDTLGSVQPAAAGRETTVHEVLDEAVHWVEIALTEQPEVEASLRTTIGNSYRSLGDLAKAEAQLQQALQLRRDDSGDESLEVAESLNSIGMLRRDQQKFDEAERLFHEALTLRRELLGPDHIGLTNSLMNLGGAMLDRGRHDEANDLFREALAIRRRVRGSGHPDVAMCLYRLAQVADAAGQPAEAIELHQQTLAIREQALHPEHPDVARSMLALGALLLRASESDQARLKPGEPASRAGRPAARAGRPAARALARQCVEVRRRSLPEGHWQIAEAQSLLGACLQAQGEFEWAEELLLQSLDVLRESRGPSDEHTRTAMRRLRELYEAWERPEEAAKYRTTAKDR